MKYLTVIRHAKTEKQKPDQRDFERRLKKSGLSAARDLGEQLAEKTGTPDAVIASPAKRAVQTAEALCEAAGIDETSISERPVLYENDMTEIMNMLKELSDDVQRVFIVGHNPSVSDLVRELCGPVIESMKTGSAAGVEIDIQSWKDIVPGVGSLGFHMEA